MSTHSQSAHWEYTLSEWNSKNHQNNLDIIFQNNDINIIYDIGANVGGTSYTFLEYAKKHNLKNPKIYSFEPDTDNMNYLKSKLKNEIEQNLIVPIEKGVYYGLKEAKVFGMGHCSENKIHPNVGGYGIEECMIKVQDNRNKSGEDVFCGQVDNKIFQLETLEKLCEKFELPDFVKIDIEGAEKNILMNSSILKKTKYMIVEWNQDEDFNVFLKEYLPEFKIINSNADFLIKNMSY